MSSDPGSAQAARALRDAGPERRLRNLLRLLAVGLGALYAGTAVLQQSMNADGMSYLDLGDAIVRGDLEMAVNAVWSPLYAAVLGVALYLFRPDPAWEFPLVHGVNFALYLGALACFEYFWRQLGRSRRELLSLDPRAGRIGLPDWAWLSLGYALFVWSSLNLIEIWSVTPDMLLAGLVYVTGGLVLRLGRSGESRLRWVALGATLGLGYLAKAVMFPLAFVFVLSAWATVGARRWRGPVIALLCFLLVASPLVVALSLQKGRPTFGDGGRVTFLRHVHGTSDPPWGRDDPELATAVHPPRQVFDDPSIFEFATPVGGTYPISYDPSYWYEGVEPGPGSGGQAAAVLSNLRFYLELLAGRVGGFTSVLLLLLILTASNRRGWRRAGRLGGGSALVLAALAALGLYSLVYVEGRYVAVFLVLLAAGSLSLVRLPASGLSRRLLAVAGALLVLVPAADVAGFGVRGAARVLGWELRQPATPGLDRPAPTGSETGRRPSARAWEVAAELRELGLAPGDAVGFIGYSWDAYWARLARLRIVAEIKPEDAPRFWRAAPARQRRALAAFAAAGAKAVVAEPQLAGGRGPAAGEPAAGWTPIGGTGYRIVLLVSADGARLDPPAFPAPPG